MGSFLIGFCLPLAGGLQLSTWLPGYPDQVTPIRVVTSIVLVGLVVVLLRGRRPTRFTTSSRRMSLALLAAWGWAAITLIWSPSVNHGLHNLLTTGVALLTAWALTCLVGYDERALPAFAAGFLIGGAAQVILAIIEVATGFHVSSQFAAGYVTAHDLPSLEARFGPLAFGSLGNPNDWGGFMLAILAVMLVPEALGLRMSRATRVAAWGLTVLGILIGLTALNDARGFRLGSTFILGMYLIHRLRLSRGARVVGLAIVGALSLCWSLAGISLSLNGLPWEVGGSSGPATPGPVTSIDPGLNSSDNLRLQLINKAVQAAVHNYGFGQGVGTEQALIDAGAIPMNFHNIIAQLLAELGFVVALAFVGFLLYVCARWALATERGLGTDSDAAFVRATLAVALLLWGVTASGVLDSPAYWTLFAAIALIPPGRATAPATGIVEQAQP